MILLPCPWCGPRNVSEFRYVGEPRRRPDVATTTPQQWRAYLYNHTNAAGWVREQWFHRAGCRQYFGAERHTITDEVRRTWRPEQAPAGAEPLLGVTDRAATTEAGPDAGGDVL
ncbi:MAG: sarcosine oxidase subunit delta [Egibacteraceae bacterium]